MIERRTKQGIIFFFLLAFIFITSCINNNRKKPKSVSINKTGELHFRRSYASIQFDSTTNIDSIEKSNPSLGNTSDSLLVMKLSALGLLDSNLGLIRSRFAKNVPKHFELVVADKKIILEIKRPLGSNEYGYYDLIATSIYGRDSIRLDGDYEPLGSDITYLLIDVFPGGFKEIVILNEYYIMNGDNSHVYIYELKNIE